MSSTMFNKPLDTEFVGKVNEFSERVDELAEQMVTYEDGKGSSTSISYNHLRIKANPYTKLVFINGYIDGLNLSAGYTIFQNFVASNALPVGDAAISAFSATCIVNAYVGSTGSLIIYTPTATSNVTLILGGMYVRI